MDPADVVAYNSIPQDETSRVSMPRTRYAREPEDPQDCKLTAMALCVLFIVGVSVIIVIPLIYSDMTHDMYHTKTYGKHGYHNLMTSNHSQDTRMGVNHSSTAPIVHVNATRTIEHTTPRTWVTTSTNPPMPHIFDVKVVMTTPKHTTVRHTTPQTSTHPHVTTLNITYPLTTPHDAIHHYTNPHITNLQNTTPHNTTPQHTAAIVTNNNITAILRNSTDLRETVEKILLSSPSSPSAATIWLVASAGLATIILLVLATSCFIKRRRYLNNRRSMMERVITDLQAADKVELLNNENMD